MVNTEVICLAVKDSKEYYDIIQSYVESLFVRGGRIDRGVAIGTTLIVLVSCRRHRQ